MNIQGARVLVTGAGGFIGSHLCEALVDHGCDVRALVRYNSAGHWGWLESIPPQTLQRLEVLPADIRDAQAVDEAVQGCDVVLHLAALIGIPFSYRAPESYVETNITGGLHVLQAVRRHGVARLLMTSTSEVYGSAQRVPVDESHPLQAQSPYSATKIAADRLAESFFRSFETPVVIARPFNTYGPRQSARAVIPAVLTQLLSGVTSLHLGRLEPTRDFNFVTDTVRAMIALVECDAAIGREVNIATGVETPIAEVVDALIAAINPQARVVSDAARLRPVESELFRLVGCNARIRALTEWRPRVDLQAGLRDCIDWFSQPEHLSRYKAWRYQV